MKEINYSYDADGFATFECDDKKITMKMSVEDFQGLLDVFKEIYKVEDLMLKNLRKLVNLL